MASANEIMSALDFSRRKMGGKAKNSAETAINLENHTIDFENAAIAAKLVVFADLAADGGAKQRPPKSRVGFHSPKCAVFCRRPAADV